MKKPGFFGDLPPFELDAGTNGDRLAKDLEALEKGSRLLEPLLDEARRQFAAAGLGDEVFVQVLTSTALPMFAETFGPEVATRFLDAAADALDELFEDGDDDDDDDDDEDEDEDSDDDHRTTRLEVGGRVYDLDTAQYLDEADEPSMPNYDGEFVLSEELWRTPEGDLFILYSTEDENHLVPLDRKQALAWVRKYLRGERASAVRSRITNA